MSAGGLACRTGAFAEAVEVFSAQGIGVIPTGPDKPSMPMVRNPASLGVRASQTLVAHPRFAHANAGVWAGQRSGLTIVDIDSYDAGHVADAINIFGDTPLKISTPSGGLHLWYRHAGEGRRIRPFGRDLPLDVLGSGLAVVPPSHRPATGSKVAGAYRVIEGDLRSLGCLPKINLGAMPAQRSAPQPAPRASSGDVREMREGDGRDNAIFAFARSAAGGCGTEAELVEAVLAENARMAEPLPAVVAQRKAAQAWTYKVKGRLMVAGTKSAVLTAAMIKACAPYPPALLLLAHLRSEHAPDHVFACVPEAIGPSLSMARGTVRRAIGFLLNIGALHLRERGGLFRDGRRPNLYRVGAIGQ